MNLKITGYSTALFSTWFFIEELGLLFDAGDGVSAGLMQKSRKIKHIFISHADRDHLTGLFQLNQLNAREGFPIVHYPADCGSFPSLEKFTKKFDPHIKGTIWIPIKENDEIEIKKDLFVKVLKNNHVETATDLSKSFSFKVFQTKRKLKAEFKNLGGQEIGKVIEQHGKDFTTDKILTNIISYSGDTPVEDFERWDNSKVLIHEATFLGNNKVKPRGNNHSHLEEVIEMVAAINIEKLVLSHFSSRYSQQEIDTSIKSLCEKYSINIPVFRILPGEIFRNILAGTPIYDPS